MTHSTHPQYIQLVPKLKKALQVHFAFDDFIFDYKLQIILKKREENLGEPSNNFFG